MAKYRNEPWRPSNALEEEVVSLQPHYDFIFGNNMADQNFYSTPARPKSHIEAAKRLKEKDLQHKQLLDPLPTDQRDKLSTIIKVQKIMNNKPLGEMPTVDDWEGKQQSERDTIAMMRRLNLGPNTDTPLNSECTIGTTSIPDEYKLIKTRHGNMPVFLGENFFKLTPVSDEKEESDVSNVCESKQSTEGESKVSDLIKFSSTEDSFNSNEEESMCEKEYPYLSLSSCSSSSFISESSYGYAPVNSYPLTSFMRPMQQNKRKKSQCRKKH